MIIEKLDLIAFGRFTDRQLDLTHHPKRFHLIYGPNESGKSTCLRAICALFFGMPRTLSDDFVHPYKKLRVGATLLDESGNRTQLIRRKADKNSLFGGDDKTPIDESVMATLLGGIDESTFTSRFGLSHQQLVEGGKAIVESKGELGEILFAAGAGVGRLKEIETELNDQRSGLFLPRGKKTLNLRLKDYDVQRKELRDRQVPPAEYDALNRSLADAETEARQINKQLSEIAPQLGRLKACLAAKKIVPEWRHERKRLNDLADVPPLDDDFVAKRREAAARTKTFETLVEKNLRRTKELENALQSTPTDETSIENEQEIIALFQEIAARAAARKDQDGLHRVVSNHNRHLRDGLRDLDVALPEDAEQAVVDRELNRLHVSDATQIRINELAADYELIRQQERDAEQRLTSLQRQLADLEDQLEQAPAAADSKTLDTVLSDIGNPDALIEQMEQQRSESGQLRDECTDLLRQLKLGDRELVDAIKLNVPAPDELDQHESVLSERKTQRDQVAQTREQALSQIAKLRESLQSLDSQRALPTEQELQQSRRQRDHQVDQIDAVRSNDQAFYQAAHALRTSIQAADHLVDTIRTYQEQIARRDAMTSELSVVEQQCGELTERLRACETQVQTAEAAWRGIWTPVGIDVRSVREMRNWLNRFGTLLVRHDALGTAESKREASESRIRRSEKRLLAAIEQTWAARPIGAVVGTVDGSELPAIESWGLEQLYDFACDLRTQWNAWATELESLRRKRSEAGDAIPAADAACQASRSRRDEWESHWRDAVGALAGQSDASPTVINNRLAKITRMFQERREREIVLHRIRSIDQDAEVYAQRVAAVATLVGLANDAKQSTSDVAAELHQRLTAARQAKRERERLQESLDDARRQLSENEQELATAQSQLSELCREAGVDSFEALPAVEARANEKRMLTASVIAAEKQLLLIAEGRPLDQFAAEVESRDTVTLEQEIAELERSHSDWNEKWQTIQQRVGGLKRERDAIDGSGCAAELNQEMQFLTGRIEHDARQYARLTVAAMILKRAIEHYRQENQSPVLKIACAAFEQLTCGRYVGLRPEFDEKGGSKLFGVQRLADGNESLVPVEAMSLGTADALYLALRTASLRHQLSAGRAVPVVIDDCLIQLDDDRSIAALKLFSELSTATQVILFTHHRHLLELAEQAMAPDDYRVHELV